MIVNLEQARAQARDRKRRQRERDQAEAARGAMPVTKEGHARLTAYSRSRSVTTTVTNPVTRRLVTRGLLIAAFVLLLDQAFVNGTTAWSQGITIQSRTAFLVIGVVADLVEFILPALGSMLWRQQRRARSMTAWCVWLFLLAFTLLASTGFSATALTDTVALRAARVTPAVELAQRKADTLTKSRADECKSGRGDRCRALEADEQKALDDLHAERSKVADEANPQATKTAALIVWLTQALVRPRAVDIANIWLLLITLLPHLSGVLFFLAGR